MPPKRSTRRASPPPCKSPRCKKPKVRSTPTARPSPKSSSATAALPNLSVAAWSPMLAHAMKGALPRGPWLVSEKLDGVRAFWDGKGGLWTRNKSRIQAPDSFVARLPRGLPLDGELFGGRGQFHRVNSAWRTGDPKAYATIQFRAFDAPSSKTPFAETYAALKKRLDTCRAGNDLGDHAPCLVKQEPLSSLSPNSNASSRMRRMLASGGEGLILRRAESVYKGGRSANMLKLKGIRDAEAVVTGYQMGTGRLAGSLGALLCRWKRKPPSSSASSAVSFKVGSGLGDRDRKRYKTLFPLGTEITVEFMELEDSGKPRHARFKGVRADI